MTNAVLKNFTRAATLAGALLGGNTALAQTVCPPNAQQALARAATEANGYTALSGNLSTLLKNAPGWTAPAPSEQYSVAVPVALRNAERCLTSLLSTLPQEVRTEQRDLGFLRNYAVTVLGDANAPLTDNDITSDASEIRGLDQGRAAFLFPALQGRHGVLTAIEYMMTHPDWTPQSPLTDAGSHSDVPSDSPIADDAVDSSVISTDAGVTDRDAGPVKVPLPPPRGNDPTSNNTGVYLGLGLLSLALLTARAKGLIGGAQRTVFDARLEPYQKNLENVLLDNLKNLKPDTLKPAIDLKTEAPFLAHEVMVAIRALAAHQDVEPQYVKLLGVNIFGVGRMPSPEGLTELLTLMKASAAFPERVQKLAAALVSYRSSTIPSVNIRGIAQTFQAINPAPLATDEYYLEHARVFADEFYSGNKTPNLTLNRDDIRTKLLAASPESQERWKMYINHLRSPGSSDSDGSGGHSKPEPDKSAENDLKQSLADYFRDIYNETKQDSPEVKDNIPNLDSLVESLLKYAKDHSLLASEPLDILNEFLKSLPEGTALHTAWLAILVASDDNHTTVTSPITTA